MCDAHMGLQKWLNRDHVDKGIQTNYPMQGRRKTSLLPKEVSEKVSHWQSMDWSCYGSQPSPTDRAPESNSLLLHSFPDKNDL